MNRAFFSMTALSMTTVAAAAAATVALALAAPATAQNVASAALAAHHHHHAHIVAKPDSAMVNTKIKLIGTGFKPHAKVTIWECTQRSWVVPANPCNHRNAVKVKADAHGGFQVQMKLLVCPAPKTSAPAGFSRRCYVGEPTIDGVDVVALRGVTKVTVTGP